MADSNLMTIPEFSVHLGYGRTYGYQLQKEGRLVMSADGKRVLVAESEARVRATEDPSKQGVASRHAEARRQKVSTPPAAAPADESEKGDGGADLEQAGNGSAGPGGYDFQVAKAKREHWAAERELAAYRKEAGELIEVSEHVAQFAKAGAVLRAGLEGWSAILPPQLVGRDEGAIRAVIAEQVEQLLRELTVQIGGMAAAQEGGA